MSTKKAKPLKLYMYWSSDWGVDRWEDTPSGATYIIITQLPKKEMESILRKDAIEIYKGRERHWPLHALMCTVGKRVGTFFTIAGEQPSALVGKLIPAANVLDLSRWLKAHNVRDLVPEKERVAIEAVWKTEELAAEKALKDRYGAERKAQDLRDYRRLRRKLMHAGRIKK